MQPPKEYFVFQNIERCSTAQEQLDYPKAYGFLQDSIRIAAIQRRMISSFFMS